MTDAIDQTSRCFYYYYYLATDAGRGLRYKSSPLDINGESGSNSHKLMEETVRGEVWEEDRNAKFRALAVTTEAARIGQWTTSEADP